MAISLDLPPPYTILRTCPDTITLLPTWSVTWPQSLIPSLPEYPQLLNLQRSSHQFAAFFITRFELLPVMIQYLHYENVHGTFVVGTMTCDTAGWGVTRWRHYPLTFTEGLERLPGILVKERI